MNRAIFVSDVHLGSKHCHAAEFADFLGRVHCKKLYLVGDIVDLWWMAQRRARWDTAHQRVVEALHALARDGTELIYVPGNHDRAARRFCGLMLPAMQVRRRVIHATADGRRLLVVHGDEYDAVTRWHLPMPGAPRRASTSPAESSTGDNSAAPLTQGGVLGFKHRLQYGIGDWLYYRILTGNQLVNRLRRRFGLRYWSLAEYLKRKSGAAERYIARFVQAGLDDVRRRGLDGIVCGHIHRAALIRQDGLVYANDGDWVESLTALCETSDGRLQLLAHTGQVLVELPSRLQLVSGTGLPQAA